MKTDQGKIIDRDSIMTEAIWRCLEEMYRISQPSCSFIEEDKKAKEKIAKGEEINDNIINEHYISSYEYETIINKYLDSYRLEAQFKDDCDLIKNYLEKGGMKRIYKSDEFGHSHKDYEKLDPIANIIGEDNAKKVFKYIEEAKDFYRFDVDESQFKFAMMQYAPSCNKEAVKKIWEDKGISIDIRDRDDEESFDLIYYGEYIPESE
ncbi:MAG: hypothetical protein J1F35_06545 [Erysipelotrichales bacterium]|nr:hypothetical protein [Erysipelotrichales bacterium]